VIGIHSLFRGIVVTLLPLVLFSCFQKGDIELNKTVEEAKKLNIGRNWKQVANMKGSSEIAVKVLSPKDTYRIGESILFKVKSNKDGYLYIIYVNDRDILSIVYPNKLEEDNRITANTVKNIPSEKNTWKIKATPPAGYSLFSFIVCPENLQNGNSRDIAVVDASEESPFSECGVSPVMIKVVE